VADLLSKAADQGVTLRDDLSLSFQ
jgi:hypothetical protein